MQQPTIPKPAYFQYLPASRDNVTLVEVLSKQQMEIFIQLPYDLYRGNQSYVPQIKKDVAATFDKEQNPAFEFCESRQWLAYRDEEVVGRIAAVINNGYIAKWQNRYMRFGWLECIDDDLVAKALLRRVEQWAKEKNMTAVHGPMGFTNFDHAGLLVMGFDQLGTFATSYNFPYYASLLENAGYKKEVDWLEYLISMPKVVPEKLAKVAAIVERRYGLQVLQNQRRKDILLYANDIFTLMNDAYADLHGMVPLTEKQIKHSCKKYLSFIRPDFVSLVLDKDKKLAAFGITMPSMSLALQKAGGKLFPFGFLHLLKAFRKNTRADLALIAVRKDMQTKGVNAILMHEMTKSYIRNGITHAESNPELETNARVQSMWQYYDTVNHKRRRCFIKQLTLPGAPILHNTQNRNQTPFI